MDDPETGNVPKLALVAPPFDLEHPPQSPLQVLRMYPALIKYLLEHGFFFVPKTVDGWGYRSLLEQLDPVCMRVLKSKGALTPDELADWITRKRLLRTRPDRTGIRQMTPATASDWVEVAYRRDLVAPFIRSVDTSRSSEPDGWRLTDQGRSTLRSPVTAAAAKIPLGPVLNVVLGGGLVAAISWFATHPTGRSALLVAIGAALYVAVMLGAVASAGRRLRPAAAVVAIETRRSAGSRLDLDTGARETRDEQIVPQRSASGQPVGDPVPPEQRGPATNPR